MAILHMCHIATGEYLVPFIAQVAVEVVFEGALNAVGGDGVALRGIKSSATHKKNHENLD